MHAIYLSAGLVTVLGLAWLTLLVGLARPGDRGSLVALALLALPAQPAVFYGARLPLDALVVRAVGKESPARAWIGSAYAPLTEEPAKLWPLVLPWWGRLTRRKQLGLAAGVLGGAFGVGEAWLIAERVAAAPQFADIPWHGFGGYVAERTQVCVAHGGLTALALASAACVAPGRWPRGLLVGLTLAMLAHWLLNLPLLVLGPSVANWSAPAFQLAAGLWVTAGFVASFVGLIALLDGRRVGVKIYGRARCPRCGAVYDRHLLWGANFGFSLRYERCGGCGGWSWTTRL